MKTELEPQDIEAIAQKVAEILKPMLARNGKTESETIFDVQGLAEYLRVSKKWVYERVQFKEVPHIKIKGQLRFSRKDIDKWLSEYKLPAVDTPERIIMPLRQTVTTSL
ncbi:MAG: helix-turn-helix domain-containing protein [Nitrospiraceae bacterium]|nr:helix-turn-helix domain-containing protein [Nitrospiraceae bacterium]